MAMFKSYVKLPDDSSHRKNQPKWKSDLVNVSCDRKKNAHMGEIHRINDPVVI